MSKELLVDNLMTVLPGIYKKLLKGLPSLDISHQQLGLLFTISKKNGMPMGYYSEKTMISKPNLTIMADKLFEEGFIERGFDKDDRRVITLSITPKGADYLNMHKAKVREAVSQKLSGLSEDEVVRLNALFDEMKQIFSKFI